MTAVERMATEYRERLERFREQAEGARETEVSRIAIDILGVHPDVVAHALRGNLTRDDEDDTGQESPPAPVPRARRT
jgi:hypothetical protein